MFDGGEQLLASGYLMPGNFQACLKATDADVKIGCLCDHCQACGNRSGLRGLIIGEGGFFTSAQPAKHIQLPAGIQIRFIGTAVAIIGRV
ncbi:hypothetical protein D3C78_1862410 [compost metagenome]